MARAPGNTPRRTRVRAEPAPTTPDPIEMAMEAEAKGVAPEGVAHEVLSKQSALIGWQIASERAGFALKVLTGAAGLTAAGLLASMAWQASRADGLVVAPFSTPPSLAARGMTGEAVAAQLIDQLALIEPFTRGASEDSRQVSSDWKPAFSVQIPQTGISLDQLQAWLRTQLGHEHRIAGEVALLDDGRLRLTARSEATPLPPVVGRADELPAMVQAVAEAIYERDQPNAYGVFLDSKGRHDDLARFARGRSQSRDVRTRAYGYTGLGVSLFAKDTLGAREAFQRSLDVFPTRMARQNLASIEEQLGRTDAAMRHNRDDLNALEMRLYDNLSERRRQEQVEIVGGFVAEAVGDYAGALAIFRGGFATPRAGFRENIAATQLAALHEITAARRELNRFEPLSAADILRRRGPAARVAEAARDWSMALAEWDAYVAARTQNAPGFVNHRATARRAEALTRLGRTGEAAALVAATPLDCEPCVQARGAVAAALGRRAEADHWYGEAVRMAPLSPFAAEAWGRARLARGDPDGAADAFRVAAGRGPRWADPVEGEGEALLAKGDARGAATKFAAAAKLAPRWGRLHLKWGEALAKLGKADEARAKRRAVAAMDLTPAERAELAALSRERTI